MKHLSQWLIELILIIFHPLLGILNYILPFKHINPSKKPPIILVERWFTRNPLHYCMKLYLEKKGFTVYCVNFSLLNGNFKSSAQDLRDYIEERHLKDVILVGISSGGLTCYQYLTDYDGWKRVRMCIGVGAPFQGAKLGFMLIGLRVKKELDPCGKYIQSVLKKPMQNGSKIFSLMAVSDQMVGHKNSYLPGSHKIIIDVAGHNLLHTVWIPTFRKVAELSSK